MRRPSEASYTNVMIDAIRAATPATTITAYVSFEPVPDVGPSFISRLRRLSGSSVGKKIGFGGWL